MKYDNAQRARIKDSEQKLSGELQKAVWSTIREYGEIRLVELANKLGRRSDSVFTCINKLAQYNMVESIKGKRGYYKVSNYILTGELK